MSGADRNKLKRLRKNYPGKVSFDAQKRSKEDEGSVAHISLCTDMGTGAGSEDDAEPQFLGSLGDEPGEGSSVQQLAEEEFGEIAFLLGEPHDCIQTPPDAAVAFFKQAEPNPQNIWDKLFLQQVHRDILLRVQNCCFIDQKYSLFMALLCCCLSMFWLPTREIILHGGQSRFIENRTVQYSTIQYSAIVIIYGTGNSVIEQSCNTK